MSSNEFQYSVFAVRKDCSALFSGVLTREDGTTPLPAGTISSLTITLTDSESGQVINSRSAQDVLGGGTGTNGVSWTDATAAFAWTLAPADNPIVGTAIAEGNYELHEALICWTWNSGARKGARKVYFRVQQLAGA